MISNLVVVNTRAKSSLTKTTSYSASLYVAKKLRQIACFISSPIGDCRIKPTPNPNTLDVLST